MGKLIVFVCMYVYVAVQGFFLFFQGGYVSIEGLYIKTCKPSSAPCIISGDNMFT